MDKELGHGAFATCKKGCEVGNENNVVAVKIFDKHKLCPFLYEIKHNLGKDEENEEKIRREINILKCLNNEHIVKMLDIS